MSVEQEDGGRAGAGATTDSSAGHAPPTSDHPHETVPQRPAEAVSWPVRSAAAWSWRLLIIGAGLAVLVYGVWIFRFVTISVFVALLLAALMQPAVSWLRRVGVPRLLAALVVFVGGIALVSAIFYFLGTLLAAGFSDISAAVTSGIGKISRWMETGPFNLGVEQLGSLTGQVQQWISGNSQRIAQGALSTASVAAQLITGLLLALIVSFFFLYDGARVWSWLVKLFPRSARERVDGAGQRAWETLAGYVQGTLIVALFDAVLITIVLFAVGLPASLAVPLGVLVFFGGFVPLIGAFVTGVLAVLVVLVTQGWVAAVVTLVGVLLVQQLEGNILQPFVLGRMVRLHPLAVLLSVTAGGIVGGIAGAVVAVPLAAVINTTASYFARTSETAVTGRREDAASRSEPA